MNRNASILQSSRRDAAFVATVWIGACLWVLGYAAFGAYGKDPSPALVMGIPQWVINGVFAPWVVCTLATCWYALGRMRDEDLGEAEEMADGAAGTDHA